MQTAVRRIGLLGIVLAVLWGLWEGWHWIGTRFELTWPFPVNDITMPHLHRIVRALFEPAQANGPWLIDILWHASLFTAKESALGLALGGIVGFAIAVVLSQSSWLERGFTPYVVASQTIPLLAIAPMVVVGLGQMNEINRLTWPNTSGIGVVPKSAVNKTATIAKAYNVIKKTPAASTVNYAWANKALAQLKAAGVDVWGKSWKPATVAVTEGGK